MVQGTQKVLMTAEGLQKIQKEYQELAKIKLPQAVSRVSRARELGDLTENSEYSAAREDLDLIEQRIAELKRTLLEAQIITPTAKSDAVIIGSTVVVEVDGEVDEFMIVGSLEADPAQKKISNESPVGKALLDAKIGETVEVSTSIVKFKYKIIEIK